LAQRHLEKFRDRLPAIETPLVRIHPEASFFSSPWTGEGRLRVIMVQNIEMFCFAPPHPNPLPQGERGFPDEN